MRFLKFNQKGFSLSELMIAAAIGVVVAGGAGFAFIETSNIYERMKNQLNTESEMFRMMHILKTTFAQTNSIFYRGSVPCNAQTQRGSPSNVAASAGMLCSGNLNATIDGSTLMLAYGLREMGGLQNTVAASRSAFQAYGVFYQYPTPTTSGALYIDLEDHQGDWTKLSPVNAPFTFTRLTEFEIRDVKYLAANSTMAVAAGAVGSGNIIQSAEIRAVMRYYGGGSTTLWKWCPAAMIAGNGPCQNFTRYFDIERVVKVNFSNNQLQPATSDTGSFTLSRRNFGNLYFFKGFNPTVRR